MFSTKPVYYTCPANIQPVNISQPYVYVQQLPNNQTVNQSVPVRIIMHHETQHQQLISSNNIATNIQSPVMHSNKNHQQAVLATCHPTINITEMPTSSMTNPTFASTPISTSIKRGRNDTSGISESHTQIRPQYPQITNMQTNRSSSGNTPVKRLRGMNQPVMLTTDNSQQPTTAACRFATTRFPFSPFPVIFSQDVREKTVIDDLTKHASEILNFKLRLVAYRRGRAENNECRILIFVEDSESFMFLYYQENWPTSLAGTEYTIKKLSIPLQLALVIPSVSLQVDWEEFTQELVDMYPGIVNVIRLRNKAQQPIRAAKLEFGSAKARKDILETGEITISHLKYRVVEFYAQANLLICSNCYGIVHFRKSCPQKHEATCKICGEKSANLKDHHCPGIPKCIHCGGAHASNDPKCVTIQQYRVALTRNFLTNVVPTSLVNSERGPLQSNRLQSHTTTSGLSCANVVKTAPSNSNSDELIARKLDSILTKVEEEPNATRQSLIEFKQEIRSAHEKTQQQVEVLEEKVKAIEKKVEDLFLRTYTIIQNICTTLHDPQSSQGHNWKSYWQEQIKSLVELRSSLGKPNNV